MGEIKVVKMRKWAAFALAACLAAMLLLFVGCGQTGAASSAASSSASASGSSAPSSASATVSSASSPSSAASGASTASSAGTSAAASSSGAGASSASTAPETSADGKQLASGTVACTTFAERAAEVGYAGSDFANDKSLLTLLVLDSPIQVTAYKGGGDYTGTVSVIRLPDDEMFRQFKDKEITIGVDDWGEFPADVTGFLYDVAVDFDEDGLVLVEPTM